MNIIAILGIKPRSLRMLGKHSTTELYPGPANVLFFKNNRTVIKQIMAHHLDDTWTWFCDAFQKDLQDGITHP
jgi:hypothetical protein